MRFRHALASSCASVAVLATSGVVHAQAAPGEAPPVSTAASAPQTQVATPPVNADQPGDNNAQEIVVTGTSIRGAPPVGSNLISVGQAQIQSTPAQSVQQILKSVPAVVGLGSAGQGAFGSADGSGTNAPTIHGLGGSASNSTLILIDGHRFPLSGINHALGDPNIVPTIAIERVEVLADGASSVYGSDAVAGVINFVTRRRYNGLEANGQLGFADNYKTYNGALLAGKTWDTGSALFAYNYSRRSALSGADRSYTRLDHTAQGGTNQANYNCQPATIQPTGSASIFASPYSGAALTAPICDFTTNTDLLPREIRNNGMVKITQEIGDKLTVSVDAVYSNRVNRQNVTRGSVQATIFNATSGRTQPAQSINQVNPFYVGVPGNTAASETVRFNADDLLGKGAHLDGRAEDFYVHGTAEYKLGSNWRVTLGGTFGIDNSSQQNIGQLCVSCAYLALNGTTNGTGSLTTASIPATGLIVTQSVTAANALDVFNVGAANRTSAATRAALVDSTTTQLARQTIKDGTLKIDGDLFRLPAGDVKVAVGGELIRYTLKQDITRPLNIGPASTGSGTTNLNYERSVESAFIELLVPVIGPEMEIPGVRSFAINLAGRYDHYSDFGTTKNPKIAANWEVFEGLKLRGNYARSFVAPALTSRGSNAAGVTGESGYTSYGLAQTNISTAAFPVAVGYLPGCAAGATTCVIGNALTTGLQINGGNADLQPQKGQTYSFGGDFTPTFARGLRLGVTYWHNRIKGGITSPIPALATNAPDLYNLLTIAPTAAQIAAAQAGLPQTGALPQNIFFIYNYRQRNVLNLVVSGIDADISYSRTTSIGKFAGGITLTRELKFQQQIGAGPSFSVLNTTGFNTTFPSVKLQGRANLGWEYAGFSVDAFLNHTGSYRNYSGTTSPANPIVRNAQGVPIGGGDHVKAYNTVDLHIGYTIPQEYMKKAQVFFDATNLFDKNPPFYNSAAGYDTFQASPIGRVITIGVRTAF